MRYNSFMQVSMIVASTLDGFIAQSEKQNSTQWTSEADKKWFGEISRECKILVMGRTTYETIGRVLPGRIIVVMSRREVANLAPLNELRDDVDEGVFVTNLAPPELLAKLQETGRKRVAICGGASIYSQFFELNLIEDIYLTIEPVMFGTGVKLIDKELYRKFTLIDQKRISDKVSVFHLRVEK